MKAAESHISKVPADVIISIFEVLIPSTLARCSLLSKTCKAAAESPSLWSAFLTNSWPTPKLQFLRGRHVKDWVVKRDSRALEHFLTQIDCCDLRFVVSKSEGRFQAAVRLGRVSIYDITNAWVSHRQMIYNVFPGNPQKLKVYRVLMSGVVSFDHMLTVWTQSISRFYELYVN